MSLNMTASSFYYAGDWLYIMWILCDSTEALLKRVNLSIDITIRYTQVSTEQIPDTFDNKVMIIQPWLSLFIACSYSYVRCTPLDGWC